MTQQYIQLLKDKGVEFYKAETFMPAKMALDAQPSLVTTASSGVPFYYTMNIDPMITEVLFAPNKMAEILGEVKKGDWATTIHNFPVQEFAGEISSYGDYNNNGKTTQNIVWESRQSYLYQSVLQYGELEEDRMALAKIQWVSGLMRSAIVELNKFQNFTYAFGVQNLVNYGLLNDPNLNASILAAPKAAGGTTWFVGTTPNATANEVYNDFVSMFVQLVNQSSGIVDINQQSDLVLGLSPQNMVALTFTNTYGITVRQMLNESYPGVQFVPAVQYSAISASNPQGNPSGNFMQLIARNAGGQETGYCAFNEKLRTHKIVFEMSAFKQKVSQGSFGAVIRQPYGICGMLGS